MTRNELIALMKRAGARGPVGPDEAWVLPGKGVSALAGLLEGPIYPPVDQQEVDVLNVDGVLLHGVFSQDDLKQILARMKALGKAK